MHRNLFAVPVFLIVFIAAAGCSGTTEKPSYSVDSNGRLSTVCPVPLVAEDVLFHNETFTKSRIIFRTDSGDVIAYLSVPEKPIAAIVYAPGAGETVAAHDSRMIRYSRAGFAFLFVDTRGNGGETGGAPFSQQLVQADYEKFRAGAWPQYYRTVCDLSSARSYIAGRYHVPVYAAGSSNGGRYAAVAAATDTAFAGYAGISTSDWGVYESVAAQGSTGDPLRFAASLEPSTYLPAISPRPVWIFHSRSDTIIPFTGGEQLFSRANDPKTFMEFSGAHGINTDVDEKLLSAWAQIYGTRG